MMYLTLVWPADLRDLLRFMCQPGALPPGVSATVQCFSGVRVAPSASAQPAEQNQASQCSGQQSDGAAHTSAAATITLSSISQCKTFLCNALELFDRVMTEIPGTFAAVIPTDALLAIADLLAHAGFSVRTLASLFDLGSHSQFSVRVLFQLALLACC